MTLRLLRPFLLRHWWSLAGALLCTVTMTAASLAAPWPLKLAIDHIAERAGRGGFDLDADDWWLLSVLSVSVLAIAAVGAASSYFVDYWLNRAGERIVHALRVATYAQLQRLSLAFHARRHKGDLVTRVTGDVNAVGTLFADTLGTLASAILTLVGMFVVCMVLDPFLTGAVFLLAPPLYFVIRHYQHMVKKAARRQRAKDGEIASLATEALTAMPVVKAFGTEQFEHDRVERSSEERLEVGVEVVRLEARFGGLVDMIGAVSTALILGAGVVSVAQGRISAGTLVVFVSYSGKLYKPLRDIARQTTRWARTMARLERIGEILRCDEVLEVRSGRASEEQPSVRTVRSASRTCRSATSPTGGPSATSTCTSTQGRRSRSSGRPARESPRSAPSLLASTTRHPAGCVSTAATPASARSSGCVSRSASSSRTRSCSAGRSGRTSPTAGWPPRGGSRSAPSSPAPRSSSTRSRTGSTPSSAREGPACREASVSASASLGCCCAILQSWCSTSRPAVSMRRANGGSWTASSP